MRFLKQHLKEIIFGLCLFVSLSVSVISSAQNNSGYGTMMFFTLTLVTVFMMVPKIKKTIESFPCVGEPVSTSNVKRIFFVFSLLSFVYFFVWFIAYYPGAYSPDSINQYAQAITGRYSDWHPVLHTWFTFTLPLKLTGTFASIGLFQIICFSLVLGTIASTIYAYCGKKWTLLLVLPIIFSPWTLNIAMFPWKDVQFTLASTMCMALATHVFFRRESWCMSILNVIFLAIFFILATLFRHNGVLFSMPLAAMLFFYMPIKRWFLFISMFLFAVMFIRGPVYAMIDVEKPGNRVLETMGFPLTVISYVAKECPQCLNKETMDFVYSMTKTEPKWKENLSLEGFNTIKYADDGVDFTVVENVGRWKILRMMLHCFWQAPVHSAIAIGGLTSIVYGLEINCDNDPKIVENDYGVLYKGNRIVQKIAICYSTIVKKTPARFFLCTIGMPLLIMLAFILFRSHMNRDHVKRALFCMPILIYDFGTMFFLSGAESRFFYVNMLICPLVVTIMISRPVDKMRDLYV